MFSIQSLTHLSTRLWGHIPQRRRRQFAALLLLMVLASVAEIISIGAVLPFLAVLTSPARVFAHPSIQFFIQAFSITSPSQLLLPLTLAFGLAALIAGIMRLTLLWASTSLSFSAGADLSISIYRRTLYQPYATHIARNSSEVISGITSKADGVIHAFILPCLTIFSAVTMLIAILSALLFINPTIALVALGGFGAIYGVIIWLTRNRLLTNSKRIARESTQVIKSLNEGLGGIRDVLIDGSQETYCGVYRNSDQALRKAQGNNVFISQSPRYVMEALGIVLIVGLAYSLAQQVEGISKGIPVLGVLALGAQRLLPVLQQMYGSWSTIKAGQASLQDALDLLDQPFCQHENQREVQPLSFESAISLDCISFRYGSESPMVIKDINLTIAKGSRIGFVGATGSGKSTLLDIIMGLLHPTVGWMKIDGQQISVSNSRGWQRHIAHVPQAIFLADGTIEENIAFGLPKEYIDHDRVKLVAEQAQLSGVIEKLPLQYETLVGERGVRLSGGQRQRIGIARALYKQADVIIFDEATSALDVETEEAVMEAIDSLSKDLTILIIAHRLSTLRGCSQIVDMSEGEIRRIGSYDEITKLS